MPDDKTILYYQCRFQQLSPLRLGTGFGEETDCDVMTDSLGLPFIPGSSLAGVLRSRMDAAGAERLFGPLLDPARGGTLRDSRVLVSDAVMDPGEAKGKYRIVPRDGVGINDRGTAVDGAKYDFETVECGAVYTAVLELDDSASPEDAAALEALLGEVCAGGISLGARTTRGYGRLRAEVYVRRFTFPRDLEAWLDFDPLDPGSFGGEKLAAARAAPDGGELRVLAELAMEGSFSVRKYTTEPEAERRAESYPEPVSFQFLHGEGKRYLDPKAEIRNRSAAPDYSPLSSREGLPVIPGTSWAGVFRHHLLDLAREICREPEKLAAMERKINALFGVPEQGGAVDKHRSRIRFAETAVRGSRSQTVTRNALDRFTAAPRSQTLFTSQVACGGSGELDIRLPRDTEPVLLRLLAASINDLSLGLLNVGGEGQVGRGLCSVKRLLVDGEDRTAALTQGKTDYLLPGGGVNGTVGS